jgi:hypothetical protein
MQMGVKVIFALDLIMKTEKGLYSFFNLSTRLEVGG